MYSIYRAWLMRDSLPLGPACANFSMPSAPAASTVPGAPDVTIQVGPTLTQFSAHRTVLTAHSGYFKAALSNEIGTTSVSVPNVNVDEFSSILTFMYTGFLDLNYNNIYNILLATHILHMPRALEICRNFLIQNRPEETAPTIIKPIPSRKLILPHQPFYQPIVTNLQSSDTTPFRAITNEKPKPPSVKSKSPVPTVPEAPKSDKKKKRQADRNDKVIIDIACCDGPVRFHRVVNNNYGLAPSETNRRTVNSNDAMNKIMNENIRDRKICDENSQDSFTCVYCNHTFKSQYCYQKHARRHLNPVGLEVGGCAAADAGSGKREVKLLDMNVQYYPCKTCGSKFPSYYFVHKHRKMCHAEEMTADRNSEGRADSNEGEKTGVNNGEEVI